MVESFHFFVLLCIEATGYTKYFPLDCCVICLVNVGSDCFSTKILFCSFLLCTDVRVTKCCTLKHIYFYCLITSSDHDHSMDFYVYVIVCFVLFFCWCIFDFLFLVIFLCISFVFFFCCSCCCCCCRLYFFCSWIASFFVNSFFLFIILFFSF